MFKRMIFLTFLIGIFASGCTATRSEALPSATTGYTATIPDSEDSGFSDAETGMLQPTGADDQIPDSATKPDEKSPAINQMPSPASDEVVINPLTGLAASDPKSLILPPALVSVTNFPPTARPQAGLSYSPIVFELFIGKGMTRFLALFYGDYPEASIAETLATDPKDISPTAEGPVIGPIRSGRLPYESLRKLYSGFIVMASAYSKVMNELNEYVNVFGDDRMDINSALIEASDLKALAASNRDELGGGLLTGMTFDPQPPEGGRAAHSLWIFFSYLNQVFWRYNTDDGTYHRWQDNADGSTFIEQTDRLNGQPLAFENVIILFADHEVEASNLIDINLLYVNRGKAKLIRDGQIYDLYWTTKSEEYEQTTGKFRPIRFIDEEGNPFPLKPGQTWIEIVPIHIACWETVNSEKYNQLAAGRSKGSGYWGLYFKLDD